MSVKVGLIGFGNIGVGVVKLLQENAELISKKVGEKIELTKISDLDITRDRGLDTSKINLTTDVNEILNDPEISIVIELIGGYEPARTFVLKAIENGKHIVTANKALLAMHGEEIFEKAAEKNVSVQFEAAVGGGIPVLSAIKGNLSANNFSSVIGILNGTCNYILTKMTKENSDFKTALKAAQDLGFAEADPTFDIEGTDTAHKLAVLVSLCFGSKIDFKDVYTEGITNITDTDVKFAAEFGYKIKLLAIGKLVNGQIEARVHPTMIPLHNPLSEVNSSFNAIRLSGDFVGTVMFYGRGAGQDPTASAIVGDLISIARAMKIGSGRYVAPLGYIESALKTLPVKPISEITSKYLLRFTVRDLPGVLASITTILGNYAISIESMVQTARLEADKNVVSIVVLTHEVLEGDIMKALSEIDKLSTVKEKTAYIRIEDNLE